MTGQAPEPGTPGPPDQPSIDSILNRLRAAADDLEAKREAVTPAKELRDQLIVEAWERGGGTVSYMTIARAARCSKTVVHDVLGTH